MIQPSSSGPYELTVSLTHAERSHTEASPDPPTSNLAASETGPDMRRTMIDREHFRSLSAPPPQLHELRNSLAHLR